MLYLTGALISKKTEKRKKPLKNNTRWVYSERIYVIFDWTSSKSNIFVFKTKWIWRYSVRFCEINDLSRWMTNGMASICLSFCSRSFPYFSSFRRYGRAFTPERYLVQIYTSIRISDVRTPVNNTSIWHNFEEKLQIPYICLIFCVDWFLVPMLFASKQGARLFFQKP